MVVPIISEAEFQQREKKAAENEGKWKTGFIVANVLTYGGASLVTAGFGVIALTGAFAAKIGEKILPEKYGKFCKESSQKLSSWGTKAVIAGALAPLFLLEAPYNYFGGSRDVGVMPMARWAARKISGITAQTDVQKMREEQSAQTLAEEEKRKQQQGVEMQQRSQSQPSGQSTSAGRNQASIQSTSTKKEQSPPALDIAIDEMKKAPNYTEAQKAYTKSLEKVPEAKKFTVAHQETDPKTKITTIVYDDPNPANKGKPEYQVTYTIGADGKPTEIAPGKLATCVLPPIPAKTGEGFEMVTIATGKQTLHNPATGVETSSVVKAEQAEKAITIAKPKGTLQMGSEPLVAASTPQTATTKQKQQGGGMAIGGNKKSTISKSSAAQLLSERG